MLFHRSGRPHATVRCHTPPRRVRFRQRTTLVGALVATLAPITLIGPGTSSAGTGESPEPSTLIARLAVIVASIDEPADVGAERSSAPPALRVTVKGEEREEVLPPPLELRDNDVLPVDALRVDDEGVPGLRHELVEVTLHNGVAVRERVVNVTVRPPEPMIVSVGTSTSSAATRNWAALAQCESGGDPTAVSRSGRYHGLYQFDQRTWESVGGTGRPSEASPDEQRRRAILLYEQRGAQPWPTCGRRL